MDEQVLSKWFDPTPENVVHARHLMSRLPSWLVPNTIEGLQAIVSELAANVVVHAHTRFEVSVRLEPTVRIEVSDSSASMPVLRHPHWDDRGGRGLVIVDAYARHWGADPIDGGKVVWADLGPLP